MQAYELYSFDTIEGYELIGILPERRRATGRITQESVVNWGKQLLGGNGKDRVILFKKIVLPSVSSEPTTESSEPWLDRHSAKIETSDSTGLARSANDQHSNFAVSRKSEVGNIIGVPITRNELPNDTGETSSYERFYGFSKKPFEMAPDPKFFYFTPCHRDVLASVMEGIKNQMGFISITGEPGTGKTTFVQFLLNRLDKKVKRVFISQTSLAFTELLKTILLELDVKIVKEKENELRTQLHRYLSHQLAKDEILALIIDEAQRLTDGAVREFTKLLETKGPLQIIFLGGPEFEERLDGEELRQLRQRIGIRCRIRALSQKESKEYMDHRLKWVGSSLAETFTPEAISTMIRYARGIPRVINILCDNAFLMSYGSHQKRVEADIIRRVIQEVEDGTLLGSLRLRFGADFQHCPS